MTAGMVGEVDIAIVGAGAAGLAAGRALRGAPVSVLILEARSRLGGRGHTETVDGHALDFGCGWLHSADINPFVALAEELGFPIDRTPPPWARRADSPGFGAAEQAEYAAALEGLEARVEAAAAGGNDRPVAALFDPAGRWTPLMNAYSSYYNGAEFDRVSIQDYAAFVDTGLNWRSPRGYGALIAAMGAGLPVMLDTPVARIDRQGGRLRLETPNGTLAARAAIVTVPTPLLAERLLAFVPDLPALREATTALPLGVANKVILRMDRPEAFPRDGRLYGDPFRTATASYHWRPFGRPLVEAYLGGSHARALETAGQGAATSFALDELAARLGSSVRAHLTPLAETRWAHDPLALGSYSHALPGGRWARAALAEPGDERIIIAGEAASPTAFSTAHGAYETGLAAAARALRLVRE